MTFHDLTPEQQRKAIILDALWQIEQGEIWATPGVYYAQPPVGVCLACAVGSVFAGALRLTQGRRIPHLNTFKSHTHENFPAFGMNLLIAMESIFEREEGMNGWPIMAQPRLVAILNRVFNKDGISPRSKMGPSDLQLDQNKLRTFLSQCGEVLNPVVFRYWASKLTEEDGEPVESFDDVAGEISAHQVPGTPVLACHQEESLAEPVPARRRLRISA